jgi:triosephosphate isomerase
MEKLFIAANWKMNGDSRFNTHLIKTINKNTHDNKVIEVIICPPFPYIDQINRLKSPFIKIGGQNISEYENGAFTGEVSASILRDMKMDYVIIGHSERRQIFNETNEIISRKFNLAHQNNLIPILCVGETFDERRNNQTKTVIETQIQSIIENTDISLFANSIIAYEPIWAIGTGETASPTIAEEVHINIREIIEAYNVESAASIPILYGGSVNSRNCQALFEMNNINGGLIGGASLDSLDFIKIYQTTEGLSK